MPTYLYKAMDSRGNIVRNRVESGSKRLLVRLLKDNDMTPIEVQQVGVRVNAKNKKKKKKKQKKEERNGENRRKENNKI